MLFHSVFFTPTDMAVQWWINLNITHAVLARIPPDLAIVLSAFANCFRLRLLERGHLALGHKEGAGI